jgi:REP element-mobilizing transposase RayT
MHTYFLTLTTYGTWLHGELGSVDDAHNVPNTPFASTSKARADHHRALLKHCPFLLNEHKRFIVDRTILEVCMFRGWRLHARNVRTNHVHIVLSAPVTPERAMNDIKAYCTRRMREAKLIGPEVRVWAHHGSTRYLNDDASIARASYYTTNEQGPPLKMSAPPGWQGGDEDDA